MEIERRVNESENKGGNNDRANISANETFL